MAQGDTEDDARWLAEKVIQLRIFDDEQGKMNRSLLDVGGALLVISQFTLMGDCRKGRRPSFVAAAQPPLAEELYETFVSAVTAHGVPVATGQFRQHMKVELVNDGPVTLLLVTKSPGGAWIKAKAMIEKIKSRNGNIKSRLMMYWPIGHPQVVNYE